MNVRRSRFSFLSVVGLAVSLNARFNAGAAGAAGGGGGAAAGGAGAGAGGGAGGAGAAGGGGPANAGSGGGAPQAPVGYRLVKDADYTTMEGHAKVGQGFSERAQNYGWKGVEDLDSLKPIFDTAKQDPQRLKLMLAALTPAQREEAKDNVEGGMSFEEAVAEAEARIETKNARKEHDAARKGVPAYIQKQIEDILGEDAADELSKESYRYMARGLLEETRDAALASADDAAKAPYMYPEGHPFRNVRPMPFNEANSAGVFTKLKELRTKLVGKTLASVGDAANKGAPRRGTAAGAGGTGGGSDKKGEKSVETSRDHIRGIVKTGMQRAGAS